jgi:hypothetical protein
MCNWAHEKRRKTIKLSKILAYCESVSKQGGKLEFFLPLGSLFDFDQAERKINQDNIICI